MGKKNDLPAMPFYFGDWFKAMDVQSLPRETKCVWFEMLGRMWESNERGYLTLNGKPMSDFAKAKILGFGDNVEEYRMHEKILDDAGIFSRREDGAIFSRFMLKMVEISDKRKQSGSKGGSKTWEFAKAKGIANTETEYENEDESKSKSFMQKQTISSAELSEGRFNPKTKEIADKWNTFAKKHGLAGNITLHSVRMAWVLERLKEPAFNFDKILSGLEKRKWGLGKDGSWKITFDKIVQDGVYYHSLIEANTIEEQKTGVQTKQQSPGGGLIIHKCSCNYETTHRRANLETSPQSKYECPQCQRTYVRGEILIRGFTGTADYSLYEIDNDQSPEEINKILNEALK